MYTFYVAQALLSDGQDIVMHVDASGADGTVFQPYYPNDIASGEAGKHFNLKTKNTFVKIHGFGRIIFQSYPAFEPQGSNLVLEIIFRSLHVILEENKQKKVRNLYVFMDNTNSNKSHGLIGGLSCLVLLGKHHKLFRVAYKFTCVYLQAKGYVEK